MAKIIDDLREEHANIKRLLLVLEKELSIFNRNERPDYEIILAIINYFQDFPDVWHHPAEHVIFDKLQARDASLAKTIGNLTAQHRDEADRLQRVADAVGSVLMDRELPRQQVHDVVRDFLAYQREHMDVEERLLFPAVLDVLRPDDWSDVESMLTQQTAALRQAAIEQSQQARERIFRWERENEEQRI